MQRNPCLALTFLVSISTLFYLLHLCKDLFRVLQFNTLGQQHFSFSITTCFAVNFPQTTVVTLRLQLPTWFLILLPILCYSIKINNHPWYSVAHKNVIWLFVAFPDACQGATSHFSSVLIMLGWAHLSLWVFYFLYFLIFWSSKNTREFQPEHLHCASAKPDFTYFHQRSGEVIHHSPATYMS